MEKVDGKEVYKTGKRRNAGQLSVRFERRSCSSSVQESNRDRGRGREVTYLHSFWGDEQEEGRDGLGSRARVDEREDLKRLALLDESCRIICRCPEKRDGRTRKG